jgi:hypothetical protein
MRISLPKLNALTELGRMTPTTTPIAIDFGTRSMKLLQLTTAETPALVSAVQFHTPDGLITDARRRLVWQFSQLAKAVKIGGFKGKRAIAALPASVTLCKHLQFPRSDTTDTRLLVEMALTQQLQCDQSALVVQHIDVGPVAGGAKHEAIGFAAGRDLVDQLMQAAREAKLEMVGLQTEFAALLNAFGYLTRRVEDAKLTSLYLNIGYSATNVAIAHGRDLVFARCIEHGGRSLDEAVAKQLKLDNSEAQATRLSMEYLTKRDREAAEVKASAPKGPELNPDRREPLESVFSPADENAPAATAAPMAGAADLTEQIEIITDEIAMCLRYYDSMFPGRRIDRAIFVGGEASHRGLCQSIARSVRLPAQVADPLARVARTGAEPVKDVDLRVGQPGWAVALGLCFSPTDL